MNSFLSELPRLYEGENYYSAARQTFSTCVNALEEMEGDAQNSFYGSEIYHSYAVSPQFIATRDTSEQARSREKRINI